MAVLYMYRLQEKVSQLAELDVRKERASLTTFTCVTPACLAFTIGKEASEPVPWPTCGQAAATERFRTLTYSSICRRLDLSVLTNALTRE